jgi:hypothetical protein
MAYTINKTDGTILTTLADGQLDNVTTDLTLIGKNYSGFGDALNENFVKLLENFAGSAIPTNAIRGQIWFDTSESKLKVYNGSSFQPVSSATIAESLPTDIAIGDLFFNSTDKQLYFYDGTSPILLGPDYSQSQGLSGLKVVNVLDDRNQTRIVTLLYVNAVLLGIFSKDTFTPKADISGFGRTEIIPGFNQATAAGIKFSVTATNSDRLGNQPASSYVRSDTSGSIEGNLSVRDNLLVGNDDQFQLVVENSNVQLANISNNKIFKVSVKKDLESEDAIIINPITRTIGLYDDNSYISSQINIGGSVSIAGNITVNGTLTVNDGDVTIVKTTELNVEDKLIVLAQTGDSSLNRDEYADEGGVVLKGAYFDEDVASPTYNTWVLKDHIFQWSNGNIAVSGTRMALADDAWNSSEHINLEAGKAFKINGTTVIDGSSLGPGITSIPGVTSFGPQIFVQIGPSAGSPVLRLEQNRLSAVAVNSDIQITPNGTGNVQLRQVTGSTYGTQTNVGFPLLRGVATTSQASPSQTGESKILLSSTELTEATNKQYVLNFVRTRALVFSIDTSDGLTNTAIEGILATLAPIDEYEVGTVARILCTSLTNANTTADVESSKSVSFTNFLTPPSGSPGTSPGLSAVSFSSVTVPAQTIQVSPRTVKTFQIQPSVGWKYISETFV